MSAGKPLVSAIVSTYNSEKFIRGKIEDLLNQTIVNKLEIVIINSNSPQNEDTIIKEYLNNGFNIKYLRTEERETIYKAWNRGIKMSSGKYITNANTDDRLKKDAYEILAGELEADPETALVHADQYVSNVPNQTFEEIKNNKIERLPDYDYFLQLDRCIVYSQPMWRASLHWQDNIWFDDNLAICGDHQFEIEVSKKYKMKHLAYPLGVFYIDKKKGNISLNNLKKVEKEKHSITEPYIIEYIDSADEGTIDELKRKFGNCIKLPLNLFRARNYFYKQFIPSVHPYTSEFVYFVMALIYKRENNAEGAAAICRKFLSKRDSDRINRLLSDLENNGSAK